MIPSLCNVKSKIFHRHKRNKKSGFLKKKEFTEICNRLRNMLLTSKKRTGLPDHLLSFGEIKIHWGSGTVILYIFGGPDKTYKSD